VENGRPWSTPWWSWSDFVEVSIRRSYQHMLIKIQQKNNLLRQKIEMRCLSCLPSLILVTVHRRYWSLTRQPSSNTKTTYESLHTFVSDTWIFLLVLVCLPSDHTPFCIQFSYIVCNGPCGQWFITVHSFSMFLDEFLSWPNSHAHKDG
jgi:hypothetical protein